MVPSKTRALRDDAVELRKASFQQIADELERRNQSYSTCLIGERFPSLIGVDPVELDLLFSKDGPSKCLFTAIAALNRGIKQVDRISLENMALANP